MNGRVSCGGDAPIDVSGRESWRELLAASRLVYGGVRTERLSGQRKMVAYLPIPGSGPDEFALVAGVRLDAFLVAASPMDGASRLLPLNRKGEVIAAADGGGAAPETVELFPPADKSLLVQYMNRLHEGAGKDGRRPSRGLNQRLSQAPDLAATRLDQRMV